MSDDKLVMRLRDRAICSEEACSDDTWSEAFADATWNLDREAATRIEQLLNALEQIEGKARLGGDCLGNSPANFKPCQDSFYLLADIARAALTGEA